MRQVWPLALMLCAGSGPNQTHALGSALTQTGSPDPRNDRICITSSCPRRLVLPIYAASSSFGSLYTVAQAIRAILLASAPQLPLWAGAPSYEPAKVASCHVVVHIE